MGTRTIDADDLARLARDREAADTAYNAALTRLDAALPAPPPALPRPERASDGAPVAPPRVAGAPEVADPPPAARGWRGWWRNAVWRILGPRLERQQILNDALVARVESIESRQAEAAGRVGETFRVLEDRLSRIAAFQSILVQYAQQITPYIDTKTREVSGLLRRVGEDTVQSTDERLAAQEEALGLVQQRELALKRELERLPGRLEASPTLSPPRSVGAAPPAGAPGLEAYTYVGFEERFRGTEVQIRQRLEAYLPYFDGSSDILDVGCGRGEFLTGLAERGITATGIDTNPAMVEMCRARRLEVTAVDAVTHLERLADGALGGLIATQVIEHLRPDYLSRFLELAYHKLRPGSHIVLETINVDSWSAFFGAYLRDPTHERPIPPETLTFLLRASGFQRVTIVTASPVPATEKLQRLSGASAEPLAEGSALTTFNANVERLNALLFGDHDYAAVAQRL